MDLLELEAGADPNIQWYYQSKKIPLVGYAKKILQSTSPLTIVDIGAGSGFFSMELDKKFGDKIKKIHLIDIHYTPEEIGSSKGLKIEKSTHIPSQIENGMIILMDVLEHLPNDLEMLQAIKAACVGDNNYFFVTVPAFRSLWSGHDEYLGHYRRYRIHTLNNALLKAGYRIEDTFYLYGVLFPVIWAIRKLNAVFGKKKVSDMKPVNPIINKVLLFITALEMKVALSNKIFGVTCVALGKI